MGKKSPLCLISGILVVVGGINWGLIGLGNFLNSDLNVVNMLLGSWPTIESIVYLLVGLAAIYMAVGMATCGSCESGSNM